MPRVLLLALLALVACDSSVVTEPPPDRPTATLRALEGQAHFGPGATFGLALSAEGPVGGFDSQRQRTLAPFASGLWLGTDASGPAEASVIWLGAYPYGNYAADRLFALDADTLYTDIGAWPTDQGAPVDADGNPLVYGDQMLWASFGPQRGSDIAAYAAPVEGLRVNAAVFGYNDMPGVRYVRYEVANIGSAPIAGLRAGYYSDTDSSAPISDAVAFDADAGLSYVYNLRQSDTGAYVETGASGFAFLQTPGGAALRAHRIMRKNNYVDPAFGETGVDGPVPFLRALDGLSNAGDPMIDPTTGAATRFAFTGDPFAGTGWRDGLADDGSYRGIDIRHLTSVDPITLAPGETAVATLVWVTADAGAPRDSYGEIRTLLDIVRATPARWAFPIASR
ncbi:hypothetical protein [Rubrivirga sp. IMCC43871]|uniref:hypothetical protein n=1 Tax=Rubrivirga sp. IMCC43871 TaxID=3391575 RepID=UPI00398FB9DB